MVMYTVKVLGSKKQDSGKTKNDVSTIEKESIYINHLARQGNRYECSRFVICIKRLYLFCHLKWCESVCEDFSWNCPKSKLPVKCCRMRRNNSDYLWLMLSICTDSLSENWTAYQTLWCAESTLRTITLRARKVRWSPRSLTLAQWLSRFCSQSKKNAFMLV